MNKSCEKATFLFPIPFTFHNFKMNLWKVKTSTIKDMTSRLWKFLSG